MSITLNKITENAGKYKILKSKVAVSKANCTKAYNKNKGTEVPMTRRRRIAAELVEHVELSKNKLHDLTKLVDSFIIVIQELEDEYFTNPDKETLLGIIQTETETYEEKHSEFMRKHDAVILEAESVLAGPNVVQQVNVPQETSEGSWRTLKKQARLKATFLEKESTHFEAVHFTKSFQNYILDGYAGNPLEIAVWIQLQLLMNPL